MKKILTIAGIAAVTLLASFGCRQHHWGFGPHGHMNPEKVSNKIAAELNLNADQKVKMDKLVKKTFDQLPDMKKDRAVLVDELIHQFESDQFNRAELNKTLSDMERDFDKIKEVMLNSGEEFYSILTPEQRRKVAQKLKKHQERMARWNDDKKPKM